MFVLSDRPSSARWLNDAERDWLANELAHEHHSHLSGLWEALRDSRVLLLALVEVGLTIGMYGITLWLPQILKSYGISSMQVGMLSAVPYLVTIVGMLAWGLVSDRVGRRPLQVAASCILSALGLWLAIATPSLGIAVAGLSLCSLGMMTARPPFWALPSTFLVGTGAAAGIALVNAIGNLGGFVGPYAIGALTESTGTFHAGLLAIAGALVVTAVLALYVGNMLAGRAGRPIGVISGEVDVTSEPAGATAASR
jgi:ACS family tartrate transporter-like MFS transporter